MVGDGQGNAAFPLPGENISQTEMGILTCSPGATEGWRCNGHILWLRPAGIFTTQGRIVVQQGTPGLSEVGVF